MERGLVSVTEHIPFSFFLSFLSLFSFVVGMFIVITPIRILLQRGAIFLLFSSHSSLCSPYVMDHLLFYLAHFTN